MSVKSFPQKSNIMIVNRTSVVPGAGISRSLEERIVEPIAYSQKRDLMNYELVADSRWAEIDFSKFTHLACNRPHSFDSLQMIKKAREARLPVIVDLDDLPIFFPEHDVSYFSPEKRKFFFESLSEATLVVNSTQRTLDWVKKEFPQVDSIHVPTGLDFDRMDQATPSPQITYPKGLTFTNTGSLKLGNFGEGWLRVMEEVLKKTGWQMEVFADGISYLPKTLPFHYHGQASWFDHKTLLNEAFPIAVTPLASHEDPSHLHYSQFKTPIKYLIYGGLGIAGIYSDCPIYTDEITNFETGVLIPNTEEAWREAVERMILDVPFRNKIAQTAKKDVRDRFSIKRAGENWAKLLKDL
jgi:hypothetical protein